MIIGDIRPARRAEPDGSSLPGPRTGSAPTAADPRYVGAMARLLAIVALMMLAPACLGVGDPSSSVETTEVQTRLNGLGDFCAAVDEMLARHDRLIETAVTDEDLLMSRYFAYRFAVEDAAPLAPADVEASFQTVLKSRLPINLLLDADADSTDLSDQQKIELFEAEDAADDIFDTHSVFCVQRLPPPGQRARDTLAAIFPRPSVEEYVAEGLTAEQAACAVARLESLDDGELTGGALVDAALRCGAVDWILDAS